MYTLGIITDRAKKGVYSPSESETTKLRIIQLPNTIPRNHRSLAYGESVSERFMMNSIPSTRNVSSVIVLLLLVASSWLPRSVINCGEEVVYRGHCGSNMPLGSRFVANCIRKSVKSPPPKILRRSVVWNEPSMGTDFRRLLTMKELMTA